MNDPCNVAGSILDIPDKPNDYKNYENCTFFNSSGFTFPTKPHKKTEIAFRLILFSAACIGNCILLIVMYKDPLQRFRNLTSYFIISLTSADLLSIFSGIAGSIIQLHPPDAYTAQLHKKQAIAACCDSIGVQCSFLMIMVFALDRYIAIAHAYMYKNIVSRQLVVVVLLLIPWGFAGIALPIIYFGEPYQDNKELSRLFAGDIIALSCITLTVHPLTHWAFTRKMKDLKTSNVIHKQMLTENLKIAKVLETTVLMVSVCLIIFTSPYVVAFSFHSAGCDKCFLNNTFQSLWLYFPLLASIRLLINAWVYAWRLPLYRKSLKTLLFQLNTGARNNRLSLNRIRQRQVDAFCNETTINKEETKSSKESTSNCELTRNKLGTVNYANQDVESKHDKNLSP